MEINKIMNDNVEIELENLTTGILTDDEDSFSYSDVINYKWENLLIFVQLK